MPVTTSTLDRPRRPIEDMRKRRQYEAIVENTVKHNVQVLKTTQRAHWEQKTDNAIRRSQRERGVAELKSGRQAELTERRIRLAELLNAEAAEHRRAVEAVGETADERKQRISSRATELYERRERERRAFVDECYRRQRRAACDDVRARDSQAVLDRVVEERKLQVAMKDQLDRMQEVQEQRYVEEWKARLVQADQDEASKLGGARERAREVKNVLDEQVASLRRRREACRQKKLQEDQEELEELGRFVEAEEAHAERRRREARERGVAVQESNRQHHVLAARAAEEERQHDLTLLDYALKCEEAATQRDETKIADEQDMARRYKSYLDGFQKQQEEDDSRVNAQRLAVENRIWEKKDEDQRKQARARDYLMAKVHASRQEQLACRWRALEDDKRERQDETRAVRELQDRLDREEADKVAQQSAAYRANMLGVRHQIAANSKNRAEERQANYLEARLQRKVRGIVVIEAAG